MCSSSEYYGKVDANEIPINEDNQVRPGNQYAVGKVGADAAAYFYYKYYGLKVIRTRFFTHTGWGRTMMSAEVNFARQIAQFEKDFKNREVKFDDKEPVYILKHGNLHSMRTWANVKDSVKAYYLLSRKGVPGEVYNIGGKENRTIEEMLDYMISLSHIRNRIVKELDSSLVRKMDVNLQIVNIKKFEECTGWSPEISFEQTIKDVLDYQRSML